MFCIKLSTCRYLRQYTCMRNFLDYIVFDTQKFSYAIAYLRMGSYAPASDVSVTLCHIPNSSSMILFPYLQGGSLYA